MWPFFLVCLLQHMADCGWQKYFLYKINIFKIFVGIIVRLWNCVIFIIQSVRVRDGELTKQRIIDLDNVLELSGMSGK